MSSGKRATEIVAACPVGQQAEGAFIVRAMHLCWAFADNQGETGFCREDGEMQVLRTESTYLARSPGYRRRIRVAAARNAVLAQLEDDVHCMSVTLWHGNGRIISIDAIMHRWPWTTCPDATEQLASTFAGYRLADVSARRQKQLNCTHLHDLAVLAAGHAEDRHLLIYDVLVSDPVPGERIMAIHRNDQAVMRWIEQDALLTSPPAIAGKSLCGLREWIAALPDADREPARLLQWGAIVAHCRTLPMDRMNRATNMPPSCYTFQPERVSDARRIVDLRDFSDGTAELFASGSPGAAEMERFLSRRP
ncbi:MAG: DUF2889 domain-containing protein [Novosphingobium sp.]